LTKVSGVKEKVHSPLYDAFFVPGPKNGTRPKKFAKMMTDPQVIRFFVDSQGKTELETNLHALRIASRRNAFEVQTMHIVVSTVSVLPRSLRHRGNKPVTQGRSSDTFLSELKFNSVSSLLVEEKNLVEMPSFWFMAGAGNALGPQDSLVNFRFGEPVIIGPQQNFRVEMRFPQDVPMNGATATGPLRIWVILDGYLTRDVQ